MNTLNAQRVAHVHDARAILLANVSCQRVSELLPIAWETVDRIKHNDIARIMYASLTEETVDRFNRSQHKTLAGLEACYTMLITCKALDISVSVA
jgi:hypothetical protein